MHKYIFRIISLTLIIALILSFVGINGSVVADSAIAISSKEDFNNIRNNLSGDYYLTCDIEFSLSDFASGGAYYNSGKCFVPIGDGKTPFTGTFDGNGYTISGIKIAVSGYVYSMTVKAVGTEVAVASDDGWTGDYIINPNNPKLNVSPAVGVFGNNKGTIKNVNIEDCTISARSSNNATLYIGGIAGHNNGDIFNCSVKNTVNGDTKSYIGGITGYQSGGNIKNCYVLGKIESEGVYGGVAGAVADGIASECYSEVMFTGTGAACFGQVDYYIQNYGMVRECYYISDIELSGFGDRLSTINAKDPDYYLNFDYRYTWYMSGARRRPALKSSKVQDIKTGDLDGDENIDLEDLVLLAQYVANWDVQSHTEVANVNFDFADDGSDIVDLRDVTYLAQNVAGWSVSILY
ncbi:MAG: hypothetical protein J6B88_08500 [Clostridia bacterium]|nr:hypothetical protein [Clostridia bacterium]